MTRPARPCTTTEARNEFPGDDPGADRARRQDTDALDREGRSVGDGIEAADVAFYGPMVFRRPESPRSERA
ncbi:hypothetical protein NKG05_12960 [Oerskovia sp. M15]